MRATNHTWGQSSSGRQNVMRSLKIHAATMIEHRVHTPSSCSRCFQRCYVARVRLYENVNQKPRGCAYFQRAGFIFARNSPHKLPQLMGPGFLFMMKHPIAGALLNRLSTNENARSKLQIMHSTSTAFLYTMAACSRTSHGIIAHLHVFEHKCLSCS